MSQSTQHNNDPLLVTLRSKISQHTINLSWEQVHNMVKNFIPEVLKDFSLHALQGGGDTLFMDTNTAAVSVTLSSSILRL